MLCLSGFELYSRWVPLGSVSSTAYVRLCNCLHASLNFIQYLLTNETGVLRNCINYVSQLRRSFFICFHFCSSYMIYFIYIFQIHLFHGNIWTHNWPAPNISGFIAQLVTAFSHEVRAPVSGDVVTGSYPVEVLNCFQVYLPSYINCVHSC